MQLKPVSSLTKTLLNLPVKEFRWSTFALRSSWPERLVSGMLKKKIKIMNQKFNILLKKKSIIHILLHRSPEKSEFIITFISLWPSKIYHSSEIAPIIYTVPASVLLMELTSFTHIWFPSKSVNLQDSTLDICPP